MKLVVFRSTVRRCGELVVTLLMRSTFVVDLTTILNVMGPAWLCVCLMVAISVLMVQRLVVPLIPGTTTRLSWLDVRLSRLIMLWH